MDFAAANFTTEAAGLLGLMRLPDRAVRQPAVGTAGDICDCVRMVQLTTQVMPDDTDEHLMFAVLQTKEMLERLKERYYALWQGEERLS